MFARIPLDRITDNPYQTRLDYGDLTDLTASLLKMSPSHPHTSGLIQVPPARLVIDDRILDPADLPCLDYEPDATVQLAAGHRRLRAFRHLLAAGHDDYATLPVDIQLLDDTAMADISWEENAPARTSRPSKRREPSGAP